MKMKRMKTFKVRGKTYNVLLQLKKDYGLKDGDEVIWWLLNEVAHSREANAKSEVIQKYEPIEPPEHLKQEAPLPIPEPEPEPPKENIRDVEKRIDELLGDR